MRMSLQRLLNIVFSKIQRLLAIPFKQSFQSWWTKFRKSAGLSRELITMVDHYISTPEFRDLSNLWKYWCKQNIEQVATHGLENFKQIAAKNYYCWTGSIAFDKSKNLFQDKELMDSMVNFNQITKKHQFMTITESISQNIITIAVYNRFKSEHGLSMLDAIEEPAFGNPPFVTLDGRMITQDLLNSLTEYITVIKTMPSINSIIEIGAGSGRTAFAFLKLIPGVKYVICDVPPALFISQSYLINQFADIKQIFKFRPFSSYDKIADEFERADIAFITPDQLGMLPNSRYDVFLAIDNLGEMKREAVQFYLNQADRLARNIYFYYSPFKFECPKRWKTVFERPMVFPKGFIEHFFTITSD